MQNWKDYDLGRLDVDGFIIDLDGTVYRGNTVIPGAAETIRVLRAAGKRVVFLSNRGNISRRMCREKLSGMGVEVSEEEILLTSTVAARFLRTLGDEEGGKVWVLGEQGLIDELQLAGVALAEKPKDAAWLLITLHEQLTYRDLNLAFQAVRHGARIIATNADRMFPGDGGDCIDVAGMIGAIVHTTGREVEVVVGKPSARMAQAALEVLELPPDRCLVIGDSLESDIRLGAAAGMRTALVLTGSVNREMARMSQVQPDFIWESICDVNDMLFIHQEEKGTGS
ncbi:HAD-IIA family hydrolase [Paenibacillus puldeungensis]|uniref:Acid sugar phosphatase n=1 Tax=Paenibacillus puldeungensis TaxID=696536 RepID=A0ABW3RYN6_9BACL